jgi:hypothetical protein
VRRASPQGFAGHWREWGILRDGRGSFRATRTSTAEGMTPNPSLQRTTQGHSPLGCR